MVMMLTLRLSAPAQATKGKANDKKAGQKERQAKEYKEPTPSPRLQHIGVARINKFHDELLTLSILLNACLLSSYLSFYSLMIPQKSR